MTIKERILHWLGLDERLDQIEEQLLDRAHDIDFIMDDVDWLERETERSFGWPLSDLIDRVTDLEFAVDMLEYDKDEISYPAIYGHQPYSPIPLVNSPALALSNDGFPLEDALLPDDAQASA